MFQMRMALFLAAAAGSVWAQPVVITSPTTINPGDVLIGGVPLATAEITVRGTTLTVNGHHTIASLQVERNASNAAGVVTHAIDYRYTESGADRFGFFLSVTGDVSVQGAQGALVASRIDVNGRGYNFGSGPGAGTGAANLDCAGGGGYGGGGGRARPDCAAALGGPDYGSISEPIDFGSGGGRDNSALGGRGGGSVRITANGTITLDGLISADGAFSAGNEAGAGAGGSIWITCADFTGSGVISSRGGEARASYGGGGSGGRVAIAAASSNFSGVIRASGGSGYSRGGAGTVWTRVGNSRPGVVIDNGGAVGIRENTEFGAAVIDADVTVRGGGRIGPRTGQTMDLIINGDLHIEPTGGMYADGYGYPSASGPGAGIGGTTFECAGGGGHGGAGGRSSLTCNDVAGGISYDQVASPVDFGSGGGRDNSAAGGDGGGAIRITVSGALTNDGVASAMGLPSQGNEAGGGAGGSIWINCGTLSGAGSFSASGGGANTSYSGGGGGGRIAIYAGSSAFAGIFSCAGGAGYSTGGAGTTLVKIGAQRATVWIDNDGASGVRETTEFYGPTTLDANVIVRGGGRLGPRVGQTDFDLTLSGNLDIEADGALYADGRGLASGVGSGAGTGGTGYECAGGGGYGGAGGGSVSSCNGAVGGITYGSVMEPRELGSGGGRDNHGLGGAGGGAIKLAVGGALTVDGTASSGGLPARGNEAGGGSGGSLWITCQSLTGAGSITANGGSASAAYAGGGGGGRIAIYASTGSSFSGLLRAGGGVAAISGGAGTALLKSGPARALIVLDNAGITGQRETTEFMGATHLDADMTIRGGARLGPRRGQTDFDLSLAGDLTVDADGAIYADGRGYASDVGPGAGVGGTNFSCASGAGFGGAGGGSISSCSGASGGVTYGSIIHPADMGSGGGRDNSSLGGAGGGAFRLAVGGMLTVNGAVTSAGLPATGNEAGGGSGGSIWIDCGQLEGEGSITADGGAAHLSFSGGGGGGRIALYCADSGFTGTLRAGGGAAAIAGGAGTALIKVGDSRALIIVDNAGISGERETTELVEPTVLDADMIVRGRARLGPRRGQPDFDLTLTGGLTVNYDGELYADGRGYSSDSGPGAGEGGSSFSCASGGAYGGAGGGSSPNCNNVPGGATYGSITQPTDLGSGGGRDNSSLAGAGGGAIRLTLGGDFIVNGAATAAGFSGANEAGGGSGGSIWVDCDRFLGTGSVTANGGSAHPSWAGGGGGGRIAVYAAQSSTFAGAYRAVGGTGVISGGAGTALIKDGTQRAVVIIDNGGISNDRETTELAGPTSLDASVIVRGRARLGPRRAQDTFALTLTGSLTVDADGEVFADGRGYQSGDGPGAGAGGTGYSCAGGGGFGGRGGNSRSDCNNAPGGLPYGDPSSPTQMGSGGGRDNSALGGAGGGLVTLDVGEYILVNGRIGANGLSGPNEAGGGSGGSLHLTCGAISGDGYLSAQGGSAHPVYAGGGGGGRIAIYSCNVLLAPDHMLVTGGSGINPGGAGSTYAGSSNIHITQQPQGGDFRGGDFFQLHVGATGNALFYQWRKRSPLGIFEPLAEGQGGVFTEVNTDTLFISGIDCSGAGEYDCLVCDSCGCFPSASAFINVDAPGDFNNDGGTDGADVEAFFAAWEAGDVEGDINLDGGIDGSDVDFFFYYWERGC